MYFRYSFNKHKCDSKATKKLSKLFGHIFLLRFDGKIRAKVKFLINFVPQRNWIALEIGPSKHKRHQNNEFLN